VGLGVAAYNLHRMGKKLIKDKPTGKGKA